jgi:hypothetical protein
VNVGKRLRCGHDKALVPETKGRSLEEIEADLQRKTGLAGRQPAAAGAQPRPSDR